MTLFVAMQMRKWDVLECTLQGPVVPGGQTVEVPPLVEGSVGFIPVFETLEALREVYPEAPYFTVKSDE